MKALKSLRRAMIVQELSELSKQVKSLERARATEQIGARAFLGHFCCHSAGHMHCNASIRR